MILYIGNKLSKHGYTPTSIETLGFFLSEFYEIRYASDKKNPGLRLLDMLYKLMRKRRDIKVVLIDTYSTSAFFYAYLVSVLSFLLKKPYIPILRGGDLPLRLERSPRISRFIFKRSFINVAPSNYLAENFKRYGFNISFIPNNIDLAQYQFKKRRNILPNLLYVRSFHEIYNPGLAIKVLKELKSFYPEAQLSMVGPDKDGSLIKTKELARQLGISDSVNFTGRLGKEEWTNLSQKYDIFINTTNYDNTPISVIEAMALGFPIVSTNVGGIPFLLSDHDNAILVNQNDGKAMVEAIIKLVENPDLTEKLSIQARKKVENEFDWNKIKYHWIELIDKAIRDNN